MRERITASRYGPLYVQLAAHADQKAWVARSAASASMQGSAGRWDCFQLSTNGTRSPALTSKVAWCARFLPTLRTGLWKQTESGPAMALMSLPLRITHGT